MRLSRTLPSFVASVMLLSGCSALRPHFPLDLTSAVSNESIDAAKDVLSESQTRIAQAALDKNGQDWTQKEIMLLSSILAVAGHAADKTGLLNTGLGIGVVSLAVNTFYDPQKTTEIHLNALSEFQCLSRISAPITNSEREIALNVVDENKKLEVLNAPRHLSEAVDEARLRYARALLAQERKDHSPSDISRFLTDYHQGVKSREAALKSAADAEENIKALEFAQGIKDIKTFLEHSQKALTAIDDNRIKSMYNALSRGKEAEIAPNDQNRWLMTQILENRKQQLRATISAAKFAGLKVELEACLKGLLR